MHDLTSAIEYCHEHWVLHRDLKTSNLLMNNRGMVQVCDFGLARKYGDPLKPYTNMVVTLWYRPPELLLGGKTYGPALDMWSLGCIFAELVLREPLLPGRGEFDQVRARVRVTVRVTVRVRVRVRVRVSLTLTLTRSTASSSCSARRERRSGPAACSCRTSRSSSSRTSRSTTWATSSGRGPPSPRAAAARGSRPRLGPNPNPDPDPNPNPNPDPDPDPNPNANQGVQLMNAMLCLNPDRRITASAALEHPYFKESPAPKAHHLMPTMPTTHAGKGKQTVKSVDAEEEEKRKAFHLR